MELKIELYECVYNKGLGNAHLLMKKNGKFLFYVEDNREHFVLCSAIVGTKEECYFLCTDYYCNIEKAIKDMKKS